MRELGAYGWTDALAAAFTEVARDGVVPGRVVEQGGVLRVHTEEGALEASVAGRMFRHSSAARPVVGDWVAVEPAADERGVIHAVLPRTTAFARRSAHQRRPQIVAANADVAFVAESLRGEVNLELVEAFLVLAWAAGAATTVVLTKADSVDDATAAVAAVGARTPDVEVVVTSKVDGRGVDRVRELLAGGHTGVLLGRSGVGKSSLVNALVGHQMLEVGETGRVRDAGRHTTTSRRLVLLSSGGLILDMPGMQDVVPVLSEDVIERLFPELEELAPECHFRDCTHLHEPGCAVRAAVEEGRIEQARYDRFVKLSAQLRAEGG